MQRDTRTILNQPNKTTPAQANMTARGQSRVASTQVNRTVGQVEGTGSQSKTTNSVNAVTCRKCKSQQVVANKRGYSFANMFKTFGIMILIGILTIVTSYLFYMYSVSDGSRVLRQIVIGLGAISFILALPVSILVGFVGRSEIVNGCMNCGFKWRPAKRK